MTATRPPRVPPHVQPPPTAAPPPRRSAQPSAHDSVICVRAPGLAISGEDGQLRGHGWQGFYQDGVRALARLEVRLGGIEPMPVQGRLTAASEARFLGVLRIPGDPDPDPALTVERLRHADGQETLTVRNSGAHPARLPLEVAVGTDLALLAEVAAGQRPADLPAQVQPAGLRWSGRGRTATVSTLPSPHAVLAGAGVLRWDLELQPGGRWSVELRAAVAPGPATASPGPASAAARPPVGRGGGVPLPWSQPEVRCDDPRAERLVRRSLDALGALLLADPDRPTDLYTASGVPWRFGLVPADALWAARMTLPLGTRLAAGTLRALARRQDTRPGPRQGLLPGPLRHAGPELPPSCSATEATLLFVTVLAEAWRWGMPRHEVAELLPAAERALHWLRESAGEGFLTDPAAGQGPETRPPDGGIASVARCEVQAHAYRAARQGAELLDGFGRSGAADWRRWADGLRDRFRAEFWLDDLSGGRPAAALTVDGRKVATLASGLVHLLDPGLTGGGALGEGLLDRQQERALAQRLASPELDSGWGLRSLGSRSPRFNALGHRSGAVRVQETALAVAGLADAGFEREAAGLLEGLLAAADHFGGRLPEMYAGEHRTAGGAPVPHPSACRPAAAAAAAAVHAVVALAGLRPDAPARRVRVTPASTAPLGELQLTGLCVAAEPFAVRISRIGVAVVEEASENLQLGV